MPLSPNEAADALRDISQTEQRSSNAYGYASASPYFILWGLVWMIGYGATDLAPRQAGLVWLVADAVGFLASFYLGWRGKLSASAGVKALKTWRVVATALAIAGFVTATFLVLPPTRSEQTGAFIPLLFAFLYAIFGIWGGVRILITGVALAALTLGGFFYLHQHFMLWMGFVGGGGLILGGIWLRSA
jgi:hypothetical protein